MKIALTFPGCHRRGGVERVVYEFAGYLAGRGHDVTVFANEWEATPGVEYRHVPVRRQPWFLNGRSYFKECSRRLDPAEFDVVSTHGCVCPTDGVHLAHSVHQAWLERSHQLRPPLSLARWKQRLNVLHPVLLQLEALHFQERRYQRVVALTEDVKRDLMRCYGVPEADVTVIPNGFAPAEFNVARCQELRAPTRARLGYDERDRVVVFVANELERKGFYPLVRAVAALNDPRVHLLAVGRLDAEACGAEIARLGLSGRVQFTGPSRDVAEYYAAADLFALPTQYEAWGLVIVEALACGLPVLTSRLAGAAVAVREGETGALLEDPLDVSEVTARLKPLLAGDHLARDPIAASVADYGWPQVLARHEQVLTDCARKAATPTFQRA